MKNIILILFFVGFQLQAQTNKNLNSVKTYLNEMQQAVDFAPNTKKAKIKKLDKVIKKGTTQRAFLEDYLQETKTNQLQEIIQDYNLILQAMILLKTDINENVPLSAEIDYLNKNIPALLEKLE